MLIDEVLPTYDVVTRHEIDVDAPLEQVYASVRGLDLADSTIIHWLFRLREVPALLTSRGRSGERVPLTLEGLVKAGGFIILRGEPS